MNVQELTEQKRDQVRDAFYIAVGLGTLSVREIRERSGNIASVVPDLFEAARTRLSERLPFEFPQISFPSVDLDKIDLPTINLTSIDVPGLKGAIEKLNDRFDEQTEAIDERFAELEARVDVVLDRVEENLPESARELLSQARGAAKEARGTIRGMVTRVA